MEYYTTVHTELYKVGESVPRTSSTGTFTKTNPYVADVWSIAIAEGASFTGYQLDQVIIPYKVGASDWSLQFTVSVVLTIDVEGVQQTYNADAAPVNMVFHYANSGLTSFTVTTSVAAFY